MPWILRQELQLSQSHRNLARVDFPSLHQGLPMQAAGKASTTKLYRPAKSISWPLVGTLLVHLFDLVPGAH